MIKLHYKAIRCIALVLLAVPALVFALTWLKPLIGIAVALALVVALERSSKCEDRVIEIKVSTLAIVALVILLWAFLSGQGEFFTQKQDYEYRNVIFRDLINYSWPVRFGGENDESLVYYIGYWLLPALFGKLVKSFAGFAAGWLVARIVIFVQTAAIIFVTVLLVLFRTGRGRKKAVFISLAVFILFSGMDALPMLIVPEKFLTHIEWWPRYFQYSSMSTQLCWVFNQAVPAWLASALTFNEKDEKSFALIGLLLLPTAPLPLVGLAAYMLAFAVRDFISSCREKKSAEFFKRIFTIQNIIAVLTLFPVFLLYYGNNAVTTDESGAGSGAVAANEGIGTFIFMYVLFVVFEFLILLFALWDREKRFELLFVGISLAIIPFIRVGDSADFCMRASVPALFMLMLLTSEYLQSELLKKKVKTKSRDYQLRSQKLLIVIVIIAIGALTPAVEYTSSMRKFVQTKGECVTEFDYMKSLSELPLGSKMNFVGTDSENSAFYKYLAKK